MRAAALLAFTAGFLIAAAPARAATSVLYVGDSLGVGTTPGLKRELGAQAAVRGDSRIGRPSGEGLGVLRELLSPADEVVVFDLGTNDDVSRPGQLAADLAAARRLTGDRCMVVATLNRPPLNGVAVDGLNNTVRAFAGGEPNVQLVDWNAIAGSQPDLLGPDRVHPTPAGYAVRAQLFAEAIAACAGADADAQTDEAERDAAQPEPRRRRRKRAKPKPVPGIEASGISFTEPVEFRSGGAKLAGELLLPTGRPPFPAVVLLHASGRVTREPYRRQAEYYASRGIAAMIFDKRGTGKSTGNPDYRYSELAADARAAVAALTARDDIAERRIALWGLSEGGFIAPMVAATTPAVAAVVAVSPVAIPPANQQTWGVRHSLDGHLTGAVATYYRLAARSGGGFERRAKDLRFDPGAWWRRVRQPVLAMWGTHDALLPIRASAAALRDALAAGPNRDRTFRWFAGPHRIGGTRYLAESARWLHARLAAKPAPSREDVALPPANGGPDVVDVTAASALSSLPLQAIWLLAPLALLVAAVRAAPRRPVFIAGALALAALMALAAGLGIALADDGVGVAKVAGIPALFALALALAIAALAATIPLARRRVWLAVAGTGLWAGLALFWLL